MRSGIIALIGFLIVIGSFLIKNVLFGSIVALIGLIITLTAILKKI